MVPCLRTQLTSSRRAYCNFITFRDTKDWDESEEIFAAASEGDVLRLEDLIARGAKVDVKVTPAQSTILFYFSTLFFFKRSRGLLGFSLKSKDKSYSDPCLDFVHTFTDAP